MKQKSLLIITLMVIITVSGYANDLMINGFISQGYLKSDDNNYLANTEKGSFEYNETAIKFSKRIDEKLSLGMQLLSRDLGDFGNNTFKLDWGFAQYELTDSSNLKIGLTKRKFGFHNDGRDVDVLRTSVFLPQTIYPEMVRSLFVANQGFSYNQYTETESGWTFDTEFMYGTINAPSDDPYIISRGEELAALVSARISELHCTVPKQYGININMDTPLEGLRLGVTSQTMDVIFDMDVVDGSATGPMTASTYLIPAYNLNATVQMKFSILSMEYAWDRFTFTYEGYKETDDTYRKPTVTLTDNGVNAIEYAALTAQLNSPIITKPESKAHYISLNYDINDELSVVLSNGEIYGDTTAAGYKNNWADYRKDFCIGFKYTLSDNTSMKLEYQDIEGIGNTLFGDATVKDWNLIAFKTTILF